MAIERRTYVEIRKSILETLVKGPRSIHEVASNSKVNWRTTELHLNYLKGRELVEEMFAHRRLRVFNITDKGRKSIDE